MCSDRDLLVFIFVRREERGTLFLQSPQSQSNENTTVNKTDLEEFRHHFAEANYTSIKCCTFYCDLFITFSAFSVRFIFLFWIEKKIQVFC